MSIVVTCACDMTYRLPDRYAGKRCRCKECGGRIKVPTAAVEPAEAARATRKGGKKRRARKKEAPRAEQRREPRDDSTRRLGAQDGEILRDRRELAHSHGKRPVSESIHQLAPLNSGDRVDDAGLEPPMTTRRGGKKTAKRARKAAAKTDAKAATRVEADAKARAKTRAARPERAARGQAKKKQRAERDQPAAQARRRGGRDALAGRRTTKRKLPARAGRRTDGELEGAAPRRASPTTHAIYAVAAILGVFVLGIGLIVGGAFGAAGAAVDVEAKLAYIHELKANRQWDHAKKEAAALEQALTEGDDPAALTRLYQAVSGVEKMVQILGVQDAETRLGLLVSNADDPDPSVRLGIAMELRGVAENPEAIDALERLALDADPRVAEGAKQGLIESGTPAAIPYLADAIEDSAATGGKLGEIALRRAVDIDHPDIVPVLLRALELRKNAPAATLRAVLERLKELGDASCVEAVKPFLEHQDAGVKAAAQGVVDALSS